MLLHAHTPSGNVDLAALLSEHPGDYAMSMGHFLDLNAEALGLFRLPLVIAAVSLVGGPLASLLLRKRARPVAGECGDGGGGVRVSAGGASGVADVCAGDQLGAAGGARLRRW